MAITLTNMSNSDNIEDTLSDFEMETVKSIPERTDSWETQQKFLRNATNDEFFIYSEFLLNNIWSDSAHKRDRLLKLDERLRRILYERRVLVRIRPEHGVLLRKSSKGDEGFNGYIPKDDGFLQFEQLGDETVVEADQEINVLQKGANWDEPLKGYNEAWNLYQDGQFTYVIPEKLYNSLEAVCRKICVELHDWNSEKDGVGTYLNTMREKGLFKPNDTMIGEWQQIQGGIQTGIQKLGSDRKRHEELDQDYCILLLHQTAAFLTFVIKRYESQYGD